MLPEIRLYGILSFSMGLLFICESFGQACCSGGTPITNNLQPVSSQGEEIILLLNFDYNYQDDLVHKQSLLDENNRQRITNAFILRPSFSLSPRVAVSAMFSHITQVERADNATGSGQTVIRAEGFGDVVVMMQYALRNTPVSSLVLGAGVKMPTGAVDHIDDRTGLLLHPDIQPGSGAWEGLAVAQVSGKWIEASLDLDAVMTYRLTENADRFAGQQKYKFGNEFQAIAGVQRPFYMTRNILVPMVSIKYRFTRHDQLNDQEAPNTGGHWIHILPALRLAMSNGIGIETYAELPLYRNLDGVQLTTSYRVGVNLVYRFALSGTSNFRTGN